MLATISLFFNSSSSTSNLFWISRSSQTNSAYPEFKYNPLFSCLFKIFVDVRHHQPTVLPHLLHLPVIYNVVILLHFFKFLHEHSQLPSKDHSCLLVVLKTSSTSVKAPLSRFSNILNIMLLIFNTSSSLFTSSYPTQAFFNTSTIL